MSEWQTFQESMYANLIFAGIYVAYKIVNRCLMSKCHYDHDGWIFDSGEEGDGVPDDKLLDMLANRALRQKTLRGGQTA